MRFRLMLALLFISFLTAYAAKTTAGTAITNTAYASYDDMEGFHYRAVSNQVILYVEQVYAIRIDPDYQEQTLNTGAEAAVRYTLTNTGNGEDRYILTVANRSGDDGDLSNLLLYIDKNSNGIIDLGESLYDNDTPPAIGAGNHIDLILSGRLDATLLSGTVSVEIGGYSRSDASKTDTHNIADIHITADGFLTLAKSEDREEALPGELVHYRIDFSNLGQLAVQGTTITTDFDNDGIPELRQGVIVADALPPYTTYVSGTATFAPVTSMLVYKGNGFWKSDSSAVSGDIVEIALFQEDPGRGVYERDQKGFIAFDVQIDSDAPEGKIDNTAEAAYSAAGTEQTPVSNTVTLTIQGVVAVTVDDTDDNGSSKGSGVPSDPDDSMIVDHAASGEWISFENEMWNFGNNPDRINLQYNASDTLNLPEGAQVEFFDMEGNPLPDTDGDGLSDTGLLDPGEKKSFETRIYLPVGSFDNVIVGIQGSSSKDPSVTDLTFDIIKHAEAIQIEIEVRVQSTVTTDPTTQSSAAARSAGSVKPLEKERLFVTEYDSTGTLTREKYFWTDSEGAIVYDDSGNRLALYNWMRDGYDYRMTLTREYENYTYYLTPIIKKEFFDVVSNPGDQQCWDLNRDNISCDQADAIISVKVQSDGTKLLVLPLDPAGYLYDGVTGSKIDGACVNFNRCTDESCRYYAAVSPSELDVYPDSVTDEENPQVSGALDGSGNDVGVWSGGFQFIYKAFTAAQEGWHFISVDFNCSLAASDPALENTYVPVALSSDAVWDPNSAEAYHGEKFYIDASFPGAILMRIPLRPSGFDQLKVEKSVAVSSASYGDMVKWTVKVTNPNTTLTVFDAVAYDQLPRGLRYKEGSTKIDGAAAADPTIASDGRRLSWALGDMTPSQLHTITFYTIVSAGAKGGKKRNVAYADGYSDTAHSIQIVSNTAEAFIRIIEGLFTDKGYIIGKVFIDDNDNKIQDENEQGVKGVKIYMEDGRYVMTDSEGKYHLDNVAAATHVLKVDRTTLPPKSELRIVNNRNLGDPGSMFADIFPGDMFKANFRLVPKREYADPDVVYNPIKGKVRLTRIIDAILVDPTSGKLSVRNSVQVDNLSAQPFYDLIFKEDSPYRPDDGSVYLNGSPYEAPLWQSSGFSWTLPIVLPDENVTLTWNSEVPKEDRNATATAGFHLEPAGRMTLMPVGVPIVFTAEGEKRYRVRVFFDFGDYTLTDAAKESLEGIVRYLRRSDYKALYIELVGHTDNIRIRKSRKDYSTNCELSKLRADAVRAYLASLLMDMRKVKLP